MGKLRIIVGGFLGIMPAGGVTWDYLQYPLGLSLMGHDVFYVEDTRLYPIYQKWGSDWDDCSGCVAHLQSVMEAFGMGQRWAYRDEASGRTFGLSAQKLADVCRTADVFINLSCATVMREEYARIPARLLIDTDPMFTQIQYITQALFTPGQSALRALIDAHNHHFTFGENIGAADCLMPLCGLSWKATRQPVCLNYWTPSAADRTAPYTTLMNWTAAKTLHYGGREWGQKDLEFLKVLQLPQSTPQVQLAIVVNRTGNVDSSFPKAQVEKAGWQVLHPDEVAGNWQDYQIFLGRSRGEFSVAKHTYVQARTGWFSCRSACYLAAGKPVVTQDTGWSKYIPAGNGLLGFSTKEEATAALLEVEANYDRHARAARELAEACFDSHTILAELLNNIGNALPGVREAALPTSTPVL